LNGRSEMKRLAVLTMIVLVGSSTALAGGWGTIFGSYYGSNAWYGCYDRDAGRAAVAIAGAAKIVQTVNDAQIQNRAMSVIEREQQFQHQQAVWGRSVQSQIQDNQITRARVFEQKANELQKENEQLRKENEEFKKKIEALQKKLEELEKKIKSLSSRSAPARLNSD